MRMHTLPGASCTQLRRELLPFPLDKARRGDVTVLPRQNTYNIANSSHFSLEALFCIATLDSVITRFYCIIIKQINIDFEAVAVKRFCPTYIEHRTRIFFPLLLAEIWNSCTLILKKLYGKFFSRPFEIKITNTLTPTYTYQYVRKNVLTYFVPDSTIL